MPAASPHPTASEDTSVGELRSDGEPGCRFQRPKFWGAGVLRWVGRCQKGFAEGPGVIVNEIEGLEPQRFYGHLVQGFLNIGVLDTVGGFMAGRWVNGVLAAQLPDDLAERNVAIEAFDVGAAAATAVSKSLAKKDAKLSSFYAQQARNLREQMD